MFGLAYCFIVVDSVVPHVDQYTESNINDRYHVLGFNQVRPAPPRKQDVSHIQILSQVKTREVAKYFAVHNNTTRSNAMTEIFSLENWLIFYFALLQILDNCGGSAASGGSFPLEVIFKDQSLVMNKSIINNEIISDQRASKLKHSCRWKTWSRPVRYWGEHSIFCLQSISWLYGSSLFAKYYIFFREAYSLSQKWELGNPKYVWVGNWVPPFWTKYKNYQLTTSLCDETRFLEWWRCEAWTLTL